jgi:hypothetical protein
MSKVAVFVEGQTELITIREMLLRMYNYSINIECLQLFKDDEFIKAEYDYSSPTATASYTIINVGNDQKVISFILEREKHFFKNGYNKLIGLRDMYSKLYREKSAVISQDLNTQFINGAIESKNTISSNSDNIHICFSIMEIEAWYLGLYHIFERLHPNLTPEYISNILGLDITIADPETAFFHPADALSRIYSSVGMIYDKHRGDIEAICRLLNIDDYETLYFAEKCNSFNIFFDIAT